MKVAHPVMKMAVCAVVGAKIEVANRDLSPDYWGAISLPFLIFAPGDDLSATSSIDASIDPPKLSDDSVADR